MGLIDRLRGKIVGLDTAPLIYYIEKNPLYFSLVKPLFVAMKRGEFEVVTSTMTIAEVLVHPFRQNNNALVSTYRGILRNTRYLRTIPFTSDIAEIAARLRAEYTLRTPDAIQMATAAAMNADFFLTNDAGLAKVTHPSVLVLKDLL